MEQIHSKKVFFLYPHSSFNEHLLDIIIQGEFEAAIINDHNAVINILRKFPNSILFANVEKQLLQSNWLEFLQSIRENSITRTAKIGIMSYNPDPEIAQELMEKIGIDCGFITLKIGIKKSATILLKTLALNEAKGRRKYIRANCPAGKAHINIRILSGTVQGSLIDISTAGFSATLDTELKVKQLCDDIQLNLWGTRMSVSARMYGTRKTEKGTLQQIFLFEPPLEGFNLQRVHSFVKRALQSEVDEIANQR